MANDLRISLLKTRGNSTNKEANNLLGDQFLKPLRLQLGQNLNYQLVVNVVVNLKMGVC